MEIDWLLIIAGWGAILSTLLAIAKLYESWTSRFQVDVTHIFRCDASIGNDIHITNLSGKPIMLEYLELYYLTGRWPRMEKKYFWSPEDSLLNLRIEPTEKKVLTFSEADHFSWGSGKKIFIKLYFVGKKPIVKRVGDSPGSK